MNKVFDIEAAERAMKELLWAMGEDADREGLLATPARSAKAWAEVTAGYSQDPANVLKTSDGKDGFLDTDGFDQMVVLRNIPFWSTCEHHLLPFSGYASIGYLPSVSGLVVGLSKLARLVDVYAKRLQVQERMTQQIAKALQSHLKADGVGVVVRATHSCMTCRGIKKEGSEMVTEVLLGSFRDHVVRDEFWTLCKRGS
jgi:GTP cyclohydrolase IA